MRLGFVSIAAVALAASSSAWAQDMNIMTEMQRQCMPDVQKHCAGEISNPNAVIQCLVTNESKLTPGCQSVSKKAAELLSIKPTKASAPAPATATAPASK
jgi:hypothetical protein